MNNRLIDLYRLADERHYYVDETCPKSIVAMSLKLGNGDKIISLTDFDSVPAPGEELPYTKNECFAHEMGHCETDSFYGFFSSLETRGKHEYRANKWAINYLIPFPELCRAVAEGNRELWQLAEYFDVSPDFVEKAISYHRQHGNSVPTKFYTKD